MELPPDYEPEQFAAETAKKVVSRALTRLTDWARTWTTLKLLGLAVSGVGFVVAAFFSMPWAAAAGCAIVTLVALTYAVAARRLMHGERARRRWQEVGLIRAERNTLKAERALEVVALAIAGDREASAGLHRVGHPGLVNAVRVLQYRKQEPLARAGTSSARADRAPQGPSKEEFAAMKARLKQRDAELVALEAQLQALAGTSNVPAVEHSRETARQARDARKAALAADRLARERGRQGMTAAPDVAEQILTVVLGAGGQPQVTRQPPPVTPEQLSPARRAEAPGQPK